MLSIPGHKSKTKSLNNKSGKRHVAGKNRTFYDGQLDQKEEEEENDKIKAVPTEIVRKCRKPTSSLPVRN